MVSYKLLARFPRPSTYCKVDPLSRALAESTRPYPRMRLGRRSYSLYGAYWRENCHDRRCGVDRYGSHPVQLTEINC